MDAALDAALSPPVDAAKPSAIVAATVVAVTVAAATVAAVTVAAATVAATLALAAATLAAAILALAAAPAWRVCGHDSDQRLDAICLKCHKYHLA